MSVIERIDETIQGKQLLDHPFYQRWSAGELTLEELREYAREYYHFTFAFPTFVSALHAHSTDMTARQALLENLIEEERGAENHPELWLRFCDALGLDRSEVLASSPSDDTRQLIDTMKSLCRDGNMHEGLAALYAYESQVPAVAAAKIDGLAKFYDMNEERAISFFAVHQEADVLHAETSRELLRKYCANAESEREAVGAARQVVGSLYRFLDGVTSGDCATVN